MSDEWVMVPREPTEAMFSASSFQEWDTFEQEWRAMLYAAPAAPQQAEPVAHVTVQHFRNNPAMRNVDCDLVADLPPGTHALYLHPPAAEVQRMREALKPFAAIESLIAAPAEQLPDPGPGAVWVKIRTDIPLDDAAPAAPQQAEPVAWVRNLTDAQPHCVTGLQYRTAADADAGVQYIPLYLHPPAAEVQRLRDALGAILKRTLDASSYRSGQDVHDIARRALEGE